MTSPDAIPELTTEQQQALDAGDGILQGKSFVIMRNDALLNWFGYNLDELQQRLQPGLEQIDRGEGDEWNLQEFLAEMHKRQAAKTE